MGQFTVCLQLKYICAQLLPLLMQCKEGNKLYFRRKKMQLANPIFVVVYIWGCRCHCVF